MSYASSKIYSISLDSIGCFRAELAKAGDENSASLRRWHSDQVQSGRLKEGRDFVIVRQSPDEQHCDDEVFYFLETVKFCQSQRSSKQFDWKLINIKSLRNHGLQIINGQVVRRNQLNLFSDLNFTATTNSNEADGINIFSSLILHFYNGVCIPQRRTDGYINANRLCQAVRNHWDNFANRLRNLAIASDRPIQNLKYPESLLSGSWVDPDIARLLIRQVDPRLARLIDCWQYNLNQYTCHHSVEKEFLEKLLFEQISSISSNLNALARTLDEVRESQYEFPIFDYWNQRIQQQILGKITVPLQYWKSFKGKPTKSIRVSSPFVYVIIIRPAQGFPGHPDIFYVGRSEKQPYQRFSNHDGLRSVEKLETYGYTYEIRYYESEVFRIPGEYHFAETALQTALDPYWEHLNTEQRTLIKQDKLVVNDLCSRLYTRNELIKVAKAG